MIVGGDLVIALMNIKKSIERILANKDVINNVISNKIEKIARTKVDKNILDIAEIQRYLDAFHILNIYEELSTARLVITVDCPKRKTTLKKQEVCNLFKEFFSSEEIPKEVCEDQGKEVVMVGDVLAYVFHVDRALSFRKNKINSKGIDKVIVLCLDNILAEFNNLSKLSLESLKKTGEEKALYYYSATSFLPEELNAKASMIELYYLYRECGLTTGTTLEAAKWDVLLKELLEDDKKIALFKSLLRVILTHELFHVYSGKSISNGLENVVEESLAEYYAYLTYNHPSFPVEKKIWQSLPRHYPYDRYTCWKEFLEKFEEKERKLVATYWKQSNNVYQFFKKLKTLQPKNGSINEALLDLLKCLYEW